MDDGTHTNGSDKAHWADKCETVDTVNHTVGYDITNGCYEDQSVHYMSFDSSNPIAAAIEDVTFAPPLNNEPSPYCGTNAINATPPFIIPRYAMADQNSFLYEQ